MYNCGKITCIEVFMLQFIKEFTFKTYVLQKNPDGPFHGSCLG